MRRWRAVLLRWCSVPNLTTQHRVHALVLGARASAAKVLPPPRAVGAPLIDLESIAQLTMARTQRRLDERRQNDVGRQRVPPAQQRRFLLLPRTELLPRSSPRVLPPLAYVREATPVAPRASPSGKVRARRLPGGLAPRRLELLRADARVVTS